MARFNDGTSEKKGTTACGRADAYSCGHIIGSEDEASPCHEGHEQLALVLEAEDHESQLDEQGRCAHHADEVCCCSGQLEAQCSADEACAPNGGGVASSSARPSAKGRATQAAQPQHFDISGSLPADLRPQNFRGLDEQNFEIIQYLVNTQGLSRREADHVISNIEVDLMNAAS